MAWCCSRSGQLGRSHSHSLQTMKLWDKSTQVTTSPLPLDAREPSTSSWSNVGKIEIIIVHVQSTGCTLNFILRNLAHYKRPSFTKISNYLSMNSANDLLLQSTEDSDENSSLISKRKISIQNNYVDVQWFNILYIIHAESRSVLNPQHLSFMIICLSESISYDRG